jgi:glycosyltransferase involved in cell wall biosynthesis
MCAGPGVGLCPYPVQLANHFKRQGHDVQAICGSDAEYETGLHDSLRDNQVPVHCIPFSEATGKAGFNPFDFSVRRAIHELRPDVVHSWGPRFAFQARSYWPTRQRPIHVAMIMSMAHDVGARWQERLAAALANRYLDRVLAACEIERERLTSIGVRPDKLQVMLAPMACPPNLEAAAAARAAGRDAVLREFELPTERKYVGCFAQFRPVKRQDLLIKSFASVLGSFPQWDLVLAGRGERFEACKELAGQLAPGRIRFLGNIPHEKSIRLMTVVDAVIHTSNIETFGYSLLEPLLLGKPAALTRVGVAKEIEKEKLALVFEPDNEAAMVAALRSLMSEDEGLAEMASRGPQWVQRAVDTPVVAHNLLDLYRRMLQQRAGAAKSA